MTNHQEMQWINHDATNVVEPPLKCWEPQIRQKFDGKISLKLYHNVKEDDKPRLQRFPSKKGVWRQILIKEYIIWVFCCKKNWTYIFYSFINIRLQTHLFWKSLQKCVLNDILFHIMIQFKCNFAIKLFGLLTL